MNAAGGAERVAELYYRFRVSKQFELSPNFQYIGNPAGDGRADAVKILGLRAQITY
jgi:high affinity Mn2+ porin